MSDACKARAHILVARSTVLAKVAWQVGAKLVACCGRTLSESCCATHMLKTFLQTQHCVRLTSSLLLLITQLIVFSVVLTGALLKICSFIRKSSALTNCLTVTIFCHFLSDYNIDLELNSKLAATC